ncbi:DUF721 domain-containing protein [Brachybacterium sp. 107]|uniref:DUF721 domain-containing protein n=1 Tax=Brachybacterium sp. 107 TaxID=3457736 RepID=UPI004034C898
MRQRLANPYDLSTWRTPPHDPDPQVGTGAAREEPTVRQEPTAREELPRGADSGRGHAGAASRPSTVTGRRPASTDLRGEADDPGEAYDPPELPTPPDPFELARRTVNRSRAAARDRGLFPISAKTQARDVRDRSGSSPGYSGSRPDPRDPQGIESVLRKVLGNLGWNAGMNAGRVLEEWDDIVGEKVSAHCRPVSLEDGVLVISASSSAWASQLRMLTPRLITTIEEHVGSHVVAELRVTGPAAAERTWKKGRRTVTWRGPRDTYG